MHELRLAGSFSPALFAGFLGCAAASPPPQGEPRPVVQARADGFTFRPAARYDAAIPTPEALLGRSIGTRFTEHRDLVAAVGAIDRASDRVELVEYGRTPEGRPLQLCFVASPRQLARKDSIAAGLRRLADARAESRVEADQPLIAWLSYNVHGNEPSSSEAALAVLYHLAAAQDPAVERLLDEVLIVLDPCLNPDGRDRYVHWYQSVVGVEPDPEPASREHDEPPPGGRVNHYYFDLNRDWAYASQDETRLRLPWLAKFPPQVHVDFHEMFPESSYFFFPADQPRNLNLPRSTLEWGERFGAGNAAAFDRHGWLYYTGEFFDLLYPGYGDSFPSLRGAIGMTYEQAGHRMAGLAYRREDDTILTLEDRVAHHFAATLATLETARAGRTGLLDHWRDFHATALREGRDGPMREIALPPGADRSSLRRLVRLLLLHGIEVDEADSAFVARGVHGYDGRDADERVLPEGTVLVSLDQPGKRLAKALLEPRAGVERPTFYDISAWSLPYAFGLPACWLEQPADVARTRLDEAALATGGRALLRGGGSVEPSGEAGAGVGFVLPWGDASAPAALLELLGAKLEARFLPRSFATAGRRFPAGSVLVRRRPGDATLEPTLRQVASRHDVEFVRLQSFATPEGIDFGSERAVALRPPRVLVLASRGAGFGELRFLLERELRVPFSCVEPGALGDVKLAEWNVIVAPDDLSSGPRGLEAAKPALEHFLRGGGTVIAFGDSAHFFTKERSGLTEVTSKKDDEATKADEKKEEEKKKVWRKSAQVERDASLESMPGALFEVELDADHPLAFGLSDRIPVVATSSRAFQVRGGGTKVGRFLPNRLSGFAGDEPQQELAGRFWLVEAEVGAGRVLLFSESPTFRLGFRGPIRVFSSALALYSR